MRAADRVVSPSRCQRQARPGRRGDPPLGLQPRCCDCCADARAAARPLFPLHAHAHGLCLCVRRAGGEAGRRERKINSRDHEDAPSATGWDGGVQSHGPPVPRSLASLRCPARKVPPPGLHGNRRARSLGATPAAEPNGVTPVVLQSTPSRTGRNKGRGTREIEGKNCTHQRAGWGFYRRRRGRSQQSELRLGLMRERA